MSDTGLTIVHVVESLDDALGGLPAAALSIAGAHARRGHRVHVVAPTRPGDTHHGLTLLDPRVDVTLVPLSRWGGRFGRSPELDRWLRDHLSTTDVAHVHSTWNLAVNGAARRARRAGVALVVSPHGSLDEFDLAKHRRAKALLGPVVVRPVLASAASVVCTTSHEERLLVTFGATCRTDVCMLPPDPPAAASPDARAVVRERLGVPAGARLLVFLGRIDYKKGLVPLMSALRRMSTPCHLAIAGRGTPEFEASIRRAAEREGVSDRVHFVGWVAGSDKSDLFAAGDAFVLLSDRENYGIAAVEAVQNGLPLVVTSEVFAAEAVTRAGAAAVTTQDPDAAADALDALLGDDSALAAATAAATRFAEVDLDRDRVDADYDALVRAAVSRARSR